MYEGRKEQYDVRLRHAIREIVFNRRIRPKERFLPRIINLVSLEDVKNVILWNRIENSWIGWREWE